MFNLSCGVLRLERIIAHDDRINSDLRCGDLSRLIRRPLD